MTRFGSIISMYVAILLLAGVRAHADNLNFEGADLVEPVCVEMPWFECRNIDGPDVPEAVFRGYQYVHLTSSTLGPDAVRTDANTFEDGTPYAATTIACSSCHFTGGHVPFGTPFYQVPDKYAERPFMLALNYNRDVEDAILDCFSNCMNNPRVPDRNDPVIQDIVAYIQWVADGVTNPTMQGANWRNMPGHELPVLDPDVANMQADPARGANLYQAECAGCHSTDGPGLGEYRAGEIRPRVPALWGDNSYTKGAAFYNNQNMAGFIRMFMPYERFALPAQNALPAQDALDIAAFINDQVHPDGPLSNQMYCHVERDRIPASLRKPAAWNVGCVYPGEPFTENDILHGPWAPITEWRNAEIARLTRSMRGVAPKIMLLLDDEN